MPKCILEEKCISENMISNTQFKSFNLFTNFSAVTANKYKCLPFAMTAAKKNLKTQKVDCPDYSDVVQMLVLDYNSLQFVAPIMG